MNRYALSVAAALLAGCGGTQTVLSPTGITPLRTENPASAPSYRIVHRFTWSRQRPVGGAHPYAGLVNVNGTLYGTTERGGSKGCYSYGCGTVYAIAKGIESVLYSFNGNTGGQDGTSPQAGLVDLNGTLYGTTSAGGANGHGTVFNITTAGVEHVLYSFKGAPDGANPTSGLIALHGTLYGTTPTGGSVCASCGTAFSVTTTGEEKVLYSFGKKGHGSGPQSALTDVRGVLYGTTTSGGTHGENGGTIFKLTTSGKESVVYSFGENAGDGFWPSAPLLDVKGTLYGTTRYGGGGCKNQGCGTIFSFTPSGTERNLYAFTGGSDGATPYNAALIYAKGALYGTTPEGGSTNCPPSGCGTIFTVGLTGSETILYRFHDAEGIEPLASLLDVGGRLYGTTETGGSGCSKKRDGEGNCGLVFVLPIP